MLQIVNVAKRLGVCATLVVAGAAAPAPADREKPPRNVVSISVSSLNQLSDEADRLGVPLPPFMTESGIERIFPFIGDKGLNPDAPIGIILEYKAGWNVSAGDGMLFMLPVVSAKTVSGALKAAGATPLPGHPDTVENNQGAIRLTGAMLISGKAGSEPAIVSIDPAEITGLYKKSPAIPAGGEDVLLRLVANAKNLRQTDTSALFKFLDSSDVSPNASPQDAQGQRIVTSLVESAIKKVDLIQLALSHSDKTLGIRLTASPVQLPAAGTFHSAGMPSDVCMTLDVAGSIRDVCPNLDDYLKQFAPAIDAGPGSVDNHKTLLCEKCTVDTLAGGKASSFGLGNKKDQGVLYIVEQSPEGKLADQMKQLSDAINQANSNSLATIEQYATDSGLSAIRLVDKENDGHTYYIDAGEKNGKRYVTFSEAPDHLLDAMVSVPHGPAMPGLISGKLKLDRFLQMGLEQSPGALSVLGDNGNKKLTELFKDKSIAYSIDGKNGDLVLQVDVAEDLVKRTMNIIQTALAGQ